MSVPELTKQQMWPHWYELRRTIWHQIPSWDDSFQEALEVMEKFLEYPNGYHP